MDANKKEEHSDSEIETPDIADILDAFKGMGYRVVDIEGQEANDASVCEQIDALWPKRDSKKDVEALRSDIDNLRSKLLHLATKQVTADYQNGDNVAENVRKGKERTVRNALKDRLTTYELLRQAEKVVKDE